MAEIEIEKIQPETKTESQSSPVVETKIEPTKTEPQTETKTKKAYNRAKSTTKRISKVVTSSEYNWISILAIAIVIIVIFWLIWKYLTKNIKVVL